MRYSQCHGPRVGCLVVAHVAAAPACNTAYLWVCSTYITASTRVSSWKTKAPTPSFFIPPLSHDVVRSCGSVKAKADADRHLLFACHQLTPREGYWTLDHHPETVLFFLFFLLFIRSILFFFIFAFALHFVSPFLAFSHGSVLFVVIACSPSFVLCVSAHRLFLVSNMQVVCEMEPLARLDSFLTTRFTCFLFSL